VGEQHFVQQLETHFSKVEFYTASALGHSPNGSPFRPLRIVEPALWVLSQSNKIWHKAS
jgi:hypothetical protein